MFNPSAYSYLVPNRVVFLKLRLFVKWNNTEFTNASCFTSFLMCSANLTLSGMVLLALPSSNNLVQFVFAEISESLPGKSCLGPFELVAFLATAVHQNSTHLDSGLLISGNLLLFAGSSCTLFLVCV
jgi:hypothetical protein